MNDPKVIKESKKFVRVIIRRPHADWFNRDHGGGVPIPGIAFLDAEDKLRGTFTFRTGDGVSALIKKMKEVARRKAL